MFVESIFNNMLWATHYLYPNSCNENTTSGLLGAQKQIIITIQTTLSKQSSTIIQSTRMDYFLNVYYNDMGWRVWRNNRICLPYLHFIRKLLRVITIAKILYKRWEGIWYYNVNFTTTQPLIYWWLSASFIDWWINGYVHANTHTNGARYACMHTCTCANEYTWTDTSRYISCRRRLLLNYISGSDVLALEEKRPIKATVFYCTPALRIPVVCNLQNKILKRRKTTTYYTIGK